MCCVFMLLWVGQDEGRTEARRPADGRHRMASGHPRRSGKSDQARPPALLLYVPVTPSLPFSLTCDASQRHPQSQPTRHPHTNSTSYWNRTARCSRNRRSQRSSCRALICWCRKRSRRTPRARLVARMNGRGCSEAVIAGCSVQNLYNVGLAR